jgi:hypothetical protein
VSPRTGEEEEVEEKELITEHSNGYQENSEACDNIVSV